MACRKAPLSALSSSDASAVSCLSSWRSSCLSATLLACLAAVPAAVLAAVLATALTALFQLCRPVPALAGQSQACLATEVAGPAPALLRLPCHPLQRQGIVRRTLAWQFPWPLALAPGLPHPRAWDGAEPDAPPEAWLGAAGRRLAAIPSFPAQELLDLLAQSPAVRLDGTPDQGGALLVAFTRRDCPACGALAALLAELAPRLGFPVGFVPAGSVQQARSFYQARPAEGGSAPPGADPALEALVQRQPALVRLFVETRLVAARLPIFCWATGGRARLASLGARDAQALIWLLSHAPDCLS